MPALPPRLEGSARCTLAFGESHNTAADQRSACAWWNCVDKCSKVWAVAGRLAWRAAPASGGVLAAATGLVLALGPPCHSIRLNLEQVVRRLAQAVADEANADEDIEHDENFHTERRGCDVPVPYSGERHGREVYTVDRWVYPLCPFGETAGGGG